MITVDLLTRAQGGKQLLVRFAGTVPDVDVFVVFCGSQQRHEVSTERRDNGTLTAIIPGTPSISVILHCCNHQQPCIPSTNPLGWLLEPEPSLSSQTISHLTPRKVRVYS